MLCDVLLPLIWLPICQTDETLSGYAPRGVPYRLEEFRGAPVVEEIWLTLPGRKQVTLSAPCGRYMSEQRLPYPWFDVQLAGPQPTGCSIGALETLVVAALDAATLVEVGGDLLILQGETGAEIVFRQVQR